MFIVLVFVALVLVVLVVYRHEGPLQCLLDLSLGHLGCFYLWSTAIKVKYCVYYPCVCDTYDGCYSGLPP